jgi:hypothetical protein
VRPSPGRSIGSRNSPSLQKGFHWVALDPPNCSSSKSKAYQTPCGGRGHRPPQILGPPVRIGTARLPPAVRSSSNLDVLSSLYQGGHGRRLIRVGFDLHDGFSRHSSKQKCPFLGVPPQESCKHEGRGRQVCAPPERSFALVDFVEREELVLEGSRGRKEVTSARKSPRRRCNLALATTVCALLDWGFANLTIGTLLSNGFRTAR